MKKIFVNKKTDMVEQILEIKDGEIIPDNYFPNCYAIEDLEGKVDAYNLRYNKDVDKFEVVEGLKAKEDVTIIPSEVEGLKQENEDLKTRIEKLEELLNVR